MVDAMPRRFCNAVASACAAASEAKACSALFVVWVGAAGADGWLASSIPAVAAPTPAAIRGMNGIIGAMANS